MRFLIVVAVSVSIAVAASLTESLFIRDPVTLISLGFLGGITAGVFGPMVTFDWWSD